MTLVDATLVEAQLVTTEKSGTGATVSLIGTPTVGNVLVGVVMQAHGAGGVMTATFGGEAMVLALDAEGLSPVLAVFTRVVDGTETGTSFSPMDNGVTYDYATALITEWSGADAVAAQGYTTQAPLTLNNGSMPDTFVYASETQLGSPGDLETAITLGFVETSAGSGNAAVASNAGTSLDTDLDGATTASLAVYDRPVADDYPAMTLTLSRTGGTLSDALSMRCYLRFSTSAVITSSTRYDIRSRRVNARELPHQVTSRMLRD